MGRASRLKRAKSAYKGTGRFFAIRQEIRDKIWFKFLMNENGRERLFKRHFPELFPDESSKNA